MQAKTWLFDDRLHLLYGARYDHYADSLTLSRDTTSHVSPRAGVIYQPTPDSAIKLLYGNAQRLASAGEIGGAPTIVAAPLDPELIDTYELVLLEQSPLWKARLSVFRSEWEDAILIVANPSAPPLLRWINVGENEAEGVEASFGWTQSRWRADLSASYVESDGETNGVDYVAFPKLIANLGLGWRIPRVEIDVYVQNRIHVGADEGPITTSIPNPDRLRDYWRTDLSFTWHHPSKKLDVYVNLLNVLDRENAFPSVFNAENGVPDLPFTAALGIRWTY